MKMKDIDVKLCPNCGSKLKWFLDDGVAAPTRTSCEQCNVQYIFMERGDGWVLELECSSSESILVAAGEAEAEYI
jgi:DNA-directed RNA polymerase subunit RPC12/RpoP